MMSVRLAMMICSIGVFITPPFGRDGSITYAVYMRPRTAIPDPEISVDLAWNYSGGICTMIVF